MKTHFIVVTLSSIFVQFILQCDGQHWSTGVFDHVKSVGNQFYNTVTTNLDEAKNVAEILAGDAKDAIETVIMKKKNFFIRYITYLCTFMIYNIVSKYSLQ